MTGAKKNGIIIENSIRAISRARGDTVERKQQPARPGGQKNAAGGRPPRPVPAGKKEAEGRHLAGAVFWTAAALACAAAAVFLTAKGCAAENKPLPPVLSSEAELRAAMKGGPRVYGLLNMELTGEPVEDVLGVLEGEYVYAGVAGEEYVEDHTTGDGTTDTSYYAWEGSEEASGERYTSGLTLFGDIPVRGWPCTVTRDTYNGPAEGNVKPWVMAKVENGYYYPTGPGDVLGNTRCRLVLAPAGGKAAFYALVGNGAVTLQGFDGADPIVQQDGDEAALNYNYTQSDTGGMVLGWLLLVPLALLFAFFAKVSYFKDQYDSN